MAEYEQPTPVNPYDSPETARPGMSGTTKVFLGLGIGCGVLVLLCCGVFGIGGYFFGKSLQSAMSQEPAKIREVTDSIVSIEVPPQLAPKMSLDWTMPFVNKKFMTMAVYADKPDHSGLVLFQLSGELADKQQMEMQFRNSMQQSGNSQWKEVELQASEAFKTEINGSPAEFTVGVGKDEKSGRAVAQATGAFSGRGGPAMLFLQVDTKEFTKDQVLEILKSMK